MQILAAMAMLALPAQGDVEAGRKAFDRCASCHALPDFRLRWDQIWYGLLPNSPCAAPVPPPGAKPGTPPVDDRASLMAFIAAETSPRPTRVEAETPITLDQGTVSCNIEEGYLLLAPKPEKPKKNEPMQVLTGYRLVWKRDEKELRRPVPEGRYTVRRYVASRDDPKTGEWTIMATGMGRAVEVKAGQETKVRLDLDVAFEARPGRKGAKVIVGGIFKGDRDMGVSIFKNNRRLEISWKVMDGKQDLAAGGCTYAAEGAFAGTLDLQAGQRFGAGMAKYFFDLAMFKLKGDPRERAIR